MWSSINEGKDFRKYNAWKLRNISYYKVAFQKLDQENKTTFNWAAFVFGVYWLIYRRMWFSATAYVVINAILIGITSVAYKNDFVLFFITVCLLIAIVFFGNSIRQRPERALHLQP